MKDKRQQLDALIHDHSEYDNGITPTDDLWPGIASRLGQQQSAQRQSSTAGRWWVTGGMSALAASVMTVAVVIGLQNSPEQKPEISEWYLLAQQMNQAQLQQVDAMANGYQLAGYEMAEGNYAESLTRLRDARKQLLLSMQAGSGDAQMIDMLRWINEQEIQLVKHAYQQQPILEEI